MSLTFDFSDFERAARRIDAFADQIPFALARSLNDAAEVTRRSLIEETWPQHVKVRNTSFLKAALSTQGQRATKSRLSVTIFDKLGRASLESHALGGTKRPRGANLAIPGSAVAGRRTGKEVPKNLRPLSLPNSFVTDGKRPNGHLMQGAIYQRQGSYHRKGSKVSRTGKVRKEAADGRTVKLMYVLKPSAPIRADVPFHQDFRTAMRREMPRAFDRNIRAAMATAFKR